MFESFPRLLLGFVTGIAFGFLLQKGQVAKFQVIVGQLLLRNFTVIKIMATAVAVGSVGVFALVSAGIADLQIVSASLGRMLIGGVLFGLGMTVLGLCPGTAVAACGEGRRDAMIGVLGMLCGALTYVLGYPLLRPAMESLGDLGKVTLPQITGTPSWIWVAGLALVLAAVLKTLERNHPKELDVVPIQTEPWH